MSYQIKTNTLLITVVLLLSGCATIKLSPQARSYYDQTQAEILKEGVAILADGCIIKSEIGTSHIIAQSSEDTGKLISSVISDQVKARGIKVTSAVTPFLCGVYKEEFVKGYTIAKVAEGDREEIKDYPLRSTGQAASSADSALLQLLALSALAKETIDKKEDTPVTPAKIDLSEEQSELIAKAVNANYVWVVNATGSKVSFGRAFGVALLTAALTGGITGGSVVSTAIPENGVIYNVALIRLDKKEVLWKKSHFLTGVNPLDTTKIYTAKWAVDALSPFFDIATSP